MLSELLRKTYGHRISYLRVLRQVSLPNTFGRLPCSAFATCRALADKLISVWECLEPCAFANRQGSSLLEMHKIIGERSDCDFWDAIGPHPRQQSKLELLGLIAQR